MKLKLLLLTLSILLAITPATAVIAAADSNFTMEIIQGSSSGGGSGGDGGGSTISHFTGVTFKGKAYANQPVFILKDGIDFTITQANEKGDFEVAFTNVTPGFYTFLLYADDKGGERSILYTLPTEIRQGMITYIDGLVVPPTLRLTHSQVKIGSHLNAYGYGIANGELIIEAAGKTKIDQAGTLGEYESAISIENLAKGEYQIKAMSTGDGVSSPYGKVVRFTVGDSNVQYTSPSCPERGDLNKDCFVNIADFSIATYWLDKTLPEDTVTRNRLDQNGDGKITLMDFSIIAFYWTG